MNGEHSNSTESVSTDLVTLLDECWKGLDPTDITSGYDVEVIANASVLLARAAHRLRELECEHAALLTGRRPTHRCKVCGALWIEWPPDPGCLVSVLRAGSWSLFSLHCGKCCDNAAMGDQIEPLPILGQRLLTPVEGNGGTVGRAIAETTRISVVDGFKVLVEEIDATGVYLDSPKDAVRFIAQCVSGALTKIIHREAK